MSSENKIQQGNIGTKFVLTIIDTNTDDVYDLTSADTLEMIFQKPNNGSAITLSAVSPVGTDGKMEYTTTSGILDIPGFWNLQGHIEGPGTIDIKTSTYEFQVNENLA